MTAFNWVRSAEQMVAYCDVPGVGHLVARRDGLGRKFVGLIDAELVILETLTLELAQRALEFVARRRLEAAAGRAGIVHDN